MATSNWQNISYNIDLVKHINPEKILDIGVGFGRWGILFREFLEVWGDNNMTGKWKRIVDGVEIFPGYLMPYHNYFYSNIYTDEALNFVSNMKETYNLINCGDVIEHLQKNDAVKLIDLCLKKSDYVLINIPVGKNWEQNSVGGNEYERHRSIWNNSDFKIYPNRILKKFRDIEYRNYSVILLSVNKINLNKSYGRYFKIKSVLRNIFHLKNF